MPAPARQSPQPSELAALEHAFAADPNSQAYRPLTEAYLAMGRFMEAMVVCKKGVKASPADPTPRVLLARIYSAQGKDHKAVEELAAALASRPADVHANRLHGELLLKLGEKDAAISALRTAWEAAPDDRDTLELLRKWGISFAPPEPPPPPAGAQDPAPVGANGAKRANGVASAAPAVAVAAAPTAPAAAPASPDAARSDEAAPEARPAPPPPRAAAGSRAAPGPRNDAYADQLASRYATQEYTLGQHGQLSASPAKRSHKRLLATVGLGAALLVVLGGWAVTSSMRKARAVEIDRLLRQTRELLEKDSYASYKEAAKLCERILERDPDALGGHAYLAYIDAVRFGEHGESEGLRDEAKKHLEAVARAGREHSHAIAAQAYLQFYAGESKAALEGLKKAMAGPEGASALLHGVLGVIEMQAGDLDGARSDLTLARQISPGDVRITQMLAEQWRRRGQGFEIQASALYDTALTRLAPDHVPSLLGKAQLLLDAGKADEAMKRVSRVLELGPAASPRQVALAHALRGSILHAQGKSAEGNAEEQQALALDPSNPDIHDILGLRRMRAGDVSGAADAFQKAIQLDGARLGFYVHLASAYMQRPGGAKQAVAALERASERAGNARVTKLLGDAYRAEGDLEHARAAYEKSIAMEKKYPEARVALARAYREGRDYARARAELDRAVAEYGETATGGVASAWAEIGDLEESRGAAPQDVEKAYVAALKADPQSCPALFWIGRSRSVKRSRVYDRPLATQMLADYVRLCPRGPHAGEAQAVLAGLR